MIHRKQKSDISNIIYTFDIEVVSLFKINGVWQNFDKNIDDYSDIDMCAVPYIWMFGIEDSVYYGREFMEFADVLEKISDKNYMKYIFIHNASYEFQFLLNIFNLKGWHIENMCSRDLRKPISWYIPELNIEFRCSYMLTNYKLETASKIYTNVKKQVGLLYYNDMYSPLCDLSMEQLKYCEYDIICLYEIIKYFREAYDNKLCNIPLTKTGMVRKELRNKLDYWYFKKMWSLVPDRNVYLVQMACFSGGYTHANILHSGRTITGINNDGCSGQDIASSYPSNFFYPMPGETFRWCEPCEFKTNDEYYYLCHVKFYNMKNKFYNTYIQKSKMLNASDDINAVYDNGRLMCCNGSFEMYITDIDFDIITHAYTGDCEILEAWKSKKRFLDIRILKYILKLYQDKTTLKGAKSDLEVSMYKSSKENINSLYGCSVSNVLRQSTDFKDGDWIRRAFTPEFIDEKLNDARKSFSTLFQHSTGLYITAWARYNVFMTLLQLDKDVLYSDTDSIKYIGDHKDVFDAFNAGVIERFRKVCEYYPDDLKLEDFSPIDSKGVQHTLGFFECENDHDVIEFRTLGAKKYCVRMSDGLHLTLSGVSKDSVKYLNDDINNFKDGFIFGYDASGKLTHYYIDDMPEISYQDKDGNMYNSDLKYGIVLAPTTYTIGVTDEYELLIKDMEIKEAEI